jgi:glycogen debranching enzyme
MMRAVSGILIRLRPRAETIYVSAGRTVLASERNGQIDDGIERGLFVHETRLLSKYSYSINGQALQPVALSNVEQHSWLGYYIIGAPGVHSEEDHGSGGLVNATQETLELRVSRYVGGGVHEDLDLTNFTKQPIAFEFSLELDADFADQIETKEGRLQRGQIRRGWSEPKTGIHELIFDYTAEHCYKHQKIIGKSAIHRSLTVRLKNASSSPIERGGRIVFKIRLSPKAHWHCCLDFIPYIDGLLMAPLYSCKSFQGTGNVFDTQRQMFLSEATVFDSPQRNDLASVVIGALEQAKYDVAALRLHDLDHGDRAWTMAAGLPVYVALFGRDVLTTAWQAALVSPAMMKGTLPELARWQGKEFNDWRDEQPGRMLHEAHTGPLEALNFNPRQRYYGSITTSSFYPVAVSELWHWTGERDLVKPLVKNSLEALHWLDQFALNRYGFYEYKSRSSQGVKNQSWKDSGDAIVYEDGSQVEPPISTCEEQGFVYLAKLHLSEVLWWLGDKQQAQTLRHQARELKKRFNDVFWLEDQGFFAMGLDAMGRPIRSAGSNPGHCLAAGIIDKSLAPRTAARLFATDLFSGWGIRTLSSQHPAYNPYSYHRGSVWPVEQGTFALGFMRYGLWDYVERITRAQFDAVSLFEHYRLPELFSGHPRDDDHPFPAMYPQANSPQAWSASSIFCLLQSMLGLYPYAPLRTLFLDPHLPEWLPEIRLSRLRVGNAVVTLRFCRKMDGSSSYEVEDLDGRLHILIQPSPWSVTAGLGERLKDAGLSLFPASTIGRTAAVASIAAGAALGWWSVKTLAKR